MNFRLVSTAGLVSVCLLSLNFTGVCSAQAPAASSPAPSPKVAPSKASPAPETVQPAAQPQTPDPANAAGAKPADSPRLARLKTLTYDRRASAILRAWSEPEDAPAAESTPAAAKKQ